jgi:ERO1-like protein alpha
LQGEHAHRIWSAIYNQSCFTDGLTCTEERVFFRLLSGMHTSISLHLVDQWLLDEAAGRWGPNMEEFERRLGRPEHKERVENLYFAYLFVLRAVLKAAPLLSAYDYTTGMEAEDAATRHLMQQLVGSGSLAWRVAQGWPVWCQLRPSRADPLLCKPLPWAAPAWPCLP